MTDADYMRHALKLAEKGCGRVSPNPMVGAVIVKDGRIIGEGYHEKYGGPHAERNALKNCTEDPRGSTVYVTLEPCCHFGKTPPCTDAVIESGIARVVIGSSDPNPKVSGGGIRKLKEHGISVETGVLKGECDRLNRVFFHYITERTPYVIMKYAMTTDGKTATYTGASRWISGEASRERVHRDRGRYSAVMAGSGTVIKDDPMLNCRALGGRDPVRIICDTRLRTPLSSRLLATAHDIRTIIATACTDSGLTEKYTACGAEILNVLTKNGHIDLSELMKLLGGLGIDSVILEGGGTLNWSALRSGIVKLVQCYISPKLFGGAEAPSPVGGMGVELPRDAFRLTAPEITRLGDDILLESEVIPNCSRE